MTTSAVVKTFMFPITWPPTTCPSLSERAALRFPSSARVPTSETISCPPSTSIIWLIKTKSIAKKVIMFLYYNLCSYYRPRGKKNWCGAGGWSKKLKHWLTVTGNFNTQNRFCFWWQSDPTCGEVGVDFHRASYIFPTPVVLGGYSTKFYARF